MRRIARLQRSIDLLGPKRSLQLPSSYLCSLCKNSSSAFSTSALRGARDKVPLTEKVRRKIWGTDHPPGQEDPYGKASAFDRTKERERELDEEEAIANAAHKKASVVDSSYEPSSTWDGLAQVGGLEEWWQKVWDPNHQFKGFMSKGVMTNGDEITATVHRALVETLALTQRGIPGHFASRCEPAEDLTQEVQVVLSPTGTPELQFPNEVTLAKIMESMLPIEHRMKVPQATSEEIFINSKSTKSEEDVVADRSTMDPLEKQAVKSYSDVVASWSPFWLQIPLEDPKIKFPLLKRVMQLTGIRFPDRAIASTRDVQTLLSHLIKPTKPRKLVQALNDKKELTQLPNVRVHQKRITSIDKEKAVGRWKVIEQELRERELPVTGHRL